MKYSIIIPTYNKYRETLGPCLISLLTYTDLEDTEIIVVANGCTDETEKEVTALIERYPNLRLLNYDKPLGYTKATNEGILRATGEYVVLLNNDTVLLPQKKSDWLKILTDPFLYNVQKVGVTGPMKEYSPSADREFILFFCAMIPRGLFGELGMLDEIFSPGYGEDTDFCCRVEDAGYAIVQVPDDSRPYYGDKLRTGNFPLYHAGNVTFKNWIGGEQLLDRNNGILKERFNKKNKVNKKPARMEQVDITFATTCDGYMSNEELTWLAENGRDKDIVIEIGSWHGRSSRAIADNMKEGAKLYCVDHWLGSKFERDTNHQSAGLEGGDAAYMEFMDNMADMIQLGKVIPLRMSSVNAAKWFAKQGIRADMIFIDAGHTYEEIKEDIEAWEPLVKDGGILCGHDYYHDGQTWPGVQQAVDERYGHKGTDMGFIMNNSIWRHVIKKKSDPAEHGVAKLPNWKLPSNLDPQVYDCFPFFNELDILERRFEELYDVVDRFVIVEATKTHQGQPKPFYFQENLNRYQKYLNKVTHIMVDDYPSVPENATVTDKSWAIERHQRDCIMRGLTQCKNNDIIIISDADEIPNKGAIRTFEGVVSEPIASLEMDLYYYNEYTKAKDKWKEAKIARYSEVKKLGPCGIRYYNTLVTIERGGKHLSYFGDVDQIVQKIEATAHAEYNTNRIKNKDRIRQVIEQGVDLYGRENVKFERV